MVLEYCTVCCFKYIFKFLISFFKVFYTYLQLHLHRYSLYLKHPYLPCSDCNITELTHTRTIFLLQISLLSSVFELKTLINQYQYKHFTIMIIRALTQLCFCTSCPKMTRPLGPEGGGKVSVEPFGTSSLFSSISSLLSVSTTRERQRKGCNERLQ